MAELQTQVQELQTAVARLQQSNDERMGLVRAPCSRPPTRSTKCHSPSAHCSNRWPPSTTPPTPNSTNSPPSCRTLAIPRRGQGAPQQSEKDLDPSRTSSSPSDAALQNLAPSQPSLRDPPPPARPPTTPHLRAALLGLFHRQRRLSGVHQASAPLPEGTATPILWSAPRRSAILPAPRVSASLPRTTGRARSALRGHPL